MCNLTMSLASQALFILDPRTLKQYSNLLGLDEEEFDRSRVVRVSHPKKCVLVAACSDDDHLDDASSTLEDTFGGGSSKTPALAIAPATTCINGISCSPGISASLSLPT